MRTSRDCHRWAGRIGVLAAIGISVLLSVAASPTVEAQSAPCGGPVTQLVNSGFEDPAIAPGAPTFSILPVSQVAGWATTETDQRMELWANGFQGVRSDGGFQHAELNANEPSTLFQVIDTKPGTTLVWQLAHRGRNGTDVVRVLIGPPGGPLVAQADLADGTTWGLHRGEYQVPAGQTNTEFAFAAVSTADGNLAQGNFLDEIYFGTAPCLLVGKHATDGSGRVLDDTAVESGTELTYRTVVRNVGGLPANVGALVDRLPPGLTYVPGSLSVEGGLVPGPRTDAVDGDGASVSTDGRTMTFGLGDPTQALGGVRIAPTEALTYLFRARVDASAGASITNVAAADYVDPFVEALQEADSNPVTIQVAEPATTTTTTVPPTPPAPPPTLTTTTTPSESTTSSDATTLGPTTTAAVGPATIGTLPPTGRGGGRPALLAALAAVAAGVVLAVLGRRRGAAT